MQAILIFFMLLAQDQLPQPGDLVIIVNPDVQSAVLKADLRRIYLNRKKRWPSGRGIETATLADGPLHRMFLEAYVGKSAAQFKTYWKRVIFTGKGSPPRTFESEGELIAFVAETPGAIGYVSKGAALDGVRVVAVE